MLCISNSLVLKSTADTFNKADVRRTRQYYVVTKPEHARCVRHGRGVVLHDRASNVGARVKTPAAAAALVARSRRRRLVIRRIIPCNQLSCVSGSAATHQLIRSTLSLSLSRRCLYTCRRTSIAWADAIIITQRTVRIGGGAGMVRKVFRLSTGDLGREVPSGVQGQSSCRSLGDFIARSWRNLTFFRIWTIPYYAVHNLYTTVGQTVCATIAHAVWTLRATVVQTVCPTVCRSVYTMQLLHGFIKIISMEMKRLTKSSAKGQTRRLNAWAGWLEPASCDSLSNSLSNCCIVWTKYYITGKACYRPALRPP